MTAKQKGDLLEDLVALMHKAPGLQIEKRKKLPCVRNRRRRREVDVLLTTTVVGYEVRLVLSCKNEATKVGIDAVDNLVGILSDVGIPVQHGILVSVNGFTSDALQSAKEKGILTLVFEGLTPDRLEQEVNAAIQSILYLLVSSVGLQIFEYLPYKAETDDRWPVVALKSEQSPEAAALFHCVWELWVRGVIPNRIGLNTVVFVPENPEIRWKVIANISVTGHLATISGQYSQFVLKDAESGAMEKAHLSSKFDEIPEKHSLRPFESEEELEEFFDNEQVLILQRVRAPRLIADIGFYPPTMAEAEELRKRFEAGENINSESTTITNLGDAWNI